MDYSDLKAAIASDAHRDDLTSEIPRFIRSAEGMIRSKLVAMSITDTIEEADRVSEGTYSLPAGLQQIRAIHKTGSNEWTLEKVSLQQLFGLSKTANPYWYAERDASNIEFRGIPGTDTTFDIEYIGHPDTLTNDTDTNTLLTNHEALYTEGALFYLYKYAQDFEAALMNALS